MDDDSAVVTAAAAGATLGAGILARKLVGAAWTKRRGVDPGEADADVSGAEAVVFVIVTGAIVGLTRLLVQRVVAAALARRVGRPQAERTAPSA